jgi:tRNA-specific 2-thiouridylase
MSGGVDSSVAAGLLVRDGYDVIGVTLSFAPCDGDHDTNWCCGAWAQSDARAVAQQLGFPYYAIDCAAEFEAEILKPAWDEYVRGRTPSPCVACNDRIKFAKLIELAHKLEAGKVATGHYARIEIDEENGNPMLLRGKDRSKDQSYFLFCLGEEKLASAIFPLGRLSKIEVRRIAQEMGLANAGRPDSQDACFLNPSEGFAESLRRRFNAPSRPGRVVDAKGNEMGSHAGVHNFTIGQRKGLRIALGRRAYVTGIDAERSQVIVSDDPSGLESTRLSASKVTWTAGYRPVLPIACQAQIRYRHNPAEAVVESERDGVVEVRFAKPQRAITPGQAVVFYCADRVLGGGWIDTAI